MTTDKSDMNGREMYIYYLFDTTDYNNLIHEHEMSAPVVSYLLIDNYDELFFSPLLSEMITGIGNSVSLFLAVMSRNERIFSEVIFRFRLCRYSGSQLSADRQL